MNEEVKAVARAYLQGLLDATPVKDRPSVDTWYAYKDFDINVDGSHYHGEGDATLCVYVYHRDDLTHATYKGKSNESSMVL